MKKIILIIASVFLFSLASYSQGGAQNILFTAKADATNGLDVYAENVSSNDISGILGASNLTLCVLVPASINPQPTVGITSPIVGQTFDVVYNDGTTTINSIVYDIYFVNGLGSTGTIDFPTNTEIPIATFSFTGIPPITSQVLLAMMPGGGTSTFDYCYIAPGGTDQTNYANPFYSDIASDPGLHNANGLNDYTLNGLSYLAVTGVTLPVKFTGFSVTKQNDNAIINWAVSNESSLTDHYEVERSLDGTNFTSIANVSVKGSGSANTYNYVDAGISSLNAASGVIYYRIQQFDKNGQSVYSEIGAVKISNSLTISAYPNPAKSFVSVSITLDQDATLALNLCDASGKQIRQLQLQGTKGNNLYKIDLDGLASGSYLLKVNSGTEISTIPIVKE